MDAFYKEWCKKHKFNGGILVGSSIRMLLEDYKKHLEKPQVTWSFVEDSIYEAAVDEDITGVTVSGLDGIMSFLNKNYNPPSLKE